MIKTLKDKKIEIKKELLKNKKEKGNLIKEKKCNKRKY